MRLAGVKVGTITDLTLNPQTFFADASLSIRNDVLLPVDSTILVSSEGLLGGNFIELLPGGALENLEPGGEIEDTQGAVSLITLLMKFVGGDSGLGPRGCGHPMRWLPLALLLCGPAAAQEVAEAQGGSLRFLDKLTSETGDVTLDRGQSAKFGRLVVRLESCRYPVANPAADSEAYLTIVEETTGLELVQRLDAGLVARAVGAGPPAL